MVSQKIDQVDLIEIAKNIWKLKRIISILIIAVFTLGYQVYIFQPYSKTINYDIKKLSSLKRFTTKENFNYEIFKKFFSHLYDFYDSGYISEYISNHDLNKKYSQGDNKFKIYVNEGNVKIKNIPFENFDQYQIIIDNMFDEIIADILIYMAKVAKEENEEYKTEIARNLKIAEMLNLKVDISVAKIIQSETESENDNANIDGKNKYNATTTQIYHRGEKVLKKELEMNNEDIKNEITKIDELSRLKSNDLYFIAIKNVPIIDRFKLFLLCIFLSIILISFFYIRKYR